MHCQKRRKYVITKGKERRIEYRCSLTNKVANCGTCKLKPSDDDIKIFWTLQVGPCQYRQVKDKKTSYCNKYKKEVNRQDCKNCLPSFMDKIKNYVKAIKGWYDIGFKSRSKEEILKIYDTYCKHCDYNVNSKCQRCGCKLSKSRIPLKNKIAMPNQHCPINLW